ncbi:hypothetical protein B0J12DRAFT_43429 [Macrophomina phaseolina]|uniref:Uncharacterized protein n=1 Tax=Macrophomina phaseolina TaxID=35725 RepID=A0ABQ8GDJ7_9PEZI|nr:hypothetical protein B0J12DRAFT_43429 [Macrophomina phaseolina]
MYSHLVPYSAVYPLKALLKMRTAGPYATGVIIRLLALLGPLSAFGPEEHNGNFRRQIPRHPSDLQAITAPSGATVRYKEPSKYGLCETTPGVNSLHRTWVRRIRRTSGAPTRPRGRSTGGKSRNPRFNCSKP